MYILRLSFPAEIWGTVSDWITILLTLITAVYAYRAYKEQVKINKANLTKHRMEIRPFFQVSFIPPEEAAVPLGYQLEVTNAFALNVTFTEYNISGQLIRQPKFEPTFDFVKTFVLPETLGPSFDPLYTCGVLEFEDEEGRKYRQEIKRYPTMYITDVPKLIRDLI